MRLAVDTHKYLLCLAYNGHGFCGWQKQKNGLSIQEVVETALSKICNTKITIVGSCRTDAGVHALGQTAVFKTARQLDTKRLQRSLNAMLAPAICVREVVSVPNSFHPIHDVRRKIYCYRILNTFYHDPFLHPYMWLVRKKLNIAIMQKESKKMIGRHDFTAFCATDSSARTKIRTLQQIDIVDKNPLLEIWFAGDGFLKQMVRITTGTLVEIGLGKELNIEKILHQRDRCNAGITAPAKGLMLMSTTYNHT